MSDEQFYRDALTRGAHNLEIALSDHQIQQLMAYHGLLVKWNKAYNLTAVRDPGQMIERHLLDSLTIAPFINGERFIDVGTGAGLPGVILAIVYPERYFDLLDSAGKKTRFLFQVKTRLQLHNIGIHHCRVESLQPESCYDGVLSRAFASLADMVTATGHLLCADGHFYAMKGQYPSDELQQLRSLSTGEKDYKVDSCHELRVPGDSAQRHLIVISASSNNDNR